jgi:uncharacterized membrane protein
MDAPVGRSPSLNVVLSIAVLAPVIAGIALVGGEIPDALLLGVAIAVVVVLAIRLAARRFLPEDEPPTIHRRAAARDPFPRHWAVAIVAICSLGLVAVLAQILSLGIAFAIGVMYLGVAVLRIQAGKHP